MDRNEYRKFLLQNMDEASIESGGDEVVCKCKYCADKPDHHHMYISIPKTDDELSYFNCFLCHSSGIVTPNKLIEWGIFDYNMGIILSEHNKGIDSNQFYTTINNAVIYNTMVNNPPSARCMEKLEYINKRLGLHLDLLDATENNIVLDLLDTLNYSYINQYTRDIRIVEALSDYFVGFLSYDRNFINLRRMVDNEPLPIHKSINKKYINYNIHGNKDNTLKFILFPCTIDKMQKVVVHVAEGPFDALSIKYNLRDPKAPNNIFAAVTGSAYKGFLKFLITGLGLIDMDIHLYLDNDKAGMYTLSDIKKFLEPFPYALYIHTNSIGKDMGVPKDQIKEVVEQIK